MTDKSTVGIPADKSTATQRKYIIVILAREDKTMFEKNPPKHILYLQKGGTKFHEQYGKDISQAIKFPDRNKAISRLNKLRKITPDRRSGLWHSIGEGTTPETFKRYFWHREDIYIVDFKDSESTIARLLNTVGQFL